MPDLTRRHLLACLSAAAACGPVTAERDPPGLHEISDRIRGIDRRSLVFVPTGLTVAGPLLLVLHDADEAEPTVLDRWRPVCQARGWVGVFPRYHKPDSGADNVLIAHLMRRSTAMGGCDPGRRFVVGQGVGGRRAYAMASANAFMVAAIAASGAPVRVSPPDLGPQDPDGLPVSVLHLHGGADPSVPVAGGSWVHPGGSHAVPALAEALAPWVAQVDGKPTQEPAPSLPSGLQQTRWKSAAGEVLLAVDPSHGAGWNPRVDPEMVAAFLDRAPRR